MYCSENFCTPETYKIRHNALYNAGYAETLLGDPHRHLAIREMETADRYFRNLFLETSTPDNIAVQNATGQFVADPRLMVEISPKAFSFSRSGPSSSEEPLIKNKGNREPSEETKKTKQDATMETYLIKGDTSKNRTVNFASGLNGEGRPSVYTFSLKRQVKKQRRQKGRQRSKMPPQRQWRERRSRKFRIATGNRILRYPLIGYQNMCSRRNKSYDTQRWIAPLLT